MQKFLGLIVAIILLCGLMGCNDQEENKTTQKQQQQQEKNSNQQSPQEKTSNKDQKRRLPTFVYHDNQYQFSLELPESWKDQFTVSKEKWFSGAEATLDFKYKNGGHILFSIIVFPFDKAAWQKHYQNSVSLQYLGTNQNQKTFAISTPSELSSDLMKNDPATIEKRAYISNMINVDLPKIIDTFQVR